MKIPTLFVPDKNVDVKIEELKNGRPSDTKQVKELLYLSYIPKKIRNYESIMDFKRIDEKDWNSHFGGHIPKYLIQAGEMAYKIPSSCFFTHIYVLEFGKGTDLNKLDKKINLEKEINQTNVAIKCLKKGEHLVAIKASELDEEYSLDVFRNWYVNNFGLEEL